MAARVGTLCGRIRDPGRPAFREGGRCMRPRHAAPRSSGQFARHIMPARSSGPAVPEPLPSATGRYSWPGSMPSGWPGRSRRPMRRSVGPYCIGSARTVGSTPPMPAWPPIPASIRAPSAAQSAPLPMPFCCLGSAGWCGRAGRFARRATLTSWSRRASRFPLRLLKQGELVPSPLSPSQATRSPRGIGSWLFWRNGPGKRRSARPGKGG